MKRKAPTAEHARLDLKYNLGVVLDVVREEIPLVAADRATYDARGQRALAVQCLQIERRLRALLAAGTELDRWLAPAANNR